MPLVPHGLNRGFYDRIRKRSADELGTDPSDPADEVGGAGLAPGLWGRIRERVRNVFPRWNWGDGGAQGRAPPSAPPPPAVGISQQEVLLRFQQGGRGRVLLLMLYNNMWRHVEPYSFRFRSKGAQPLMFGYCRVHREIHSFRPDRVQGLALTDEGYAPRWTVEF